MKNVTFEMTTNEKIVGVETMKTRVERFHFARLDRIGMPWKKEMYETEGMPKNTILKLYRELPENIIADDRFRACEMYVPENDFGNIA